MSDEPFPVKYELPDPESDVAPEDPNVHYREALTIWADCMSAQVRAEGEIAMHHYDQPPRFSEAGEPYRLSSSAACLLRDLLNAATVRGFLPRPEGLAAEDAAAIGSRPTFVTQVSRAYQQGLADARRDRE